MDSSADRLRVVVADDDPDIRALVRYQLAGAGCVVREVPDGEAALAAAQAWDPHLVILDVRMPRLSGLQVCRALRTDPRTGHIPVLLLSAAAGTADVAAGFAAGATEYVVKPFRARDLLDRVVLLAAVHGPAVIPGSAPGVPGVLAGAR